MFAFVLATPTINLFIIFHTIIHGCLPPGDKCSTGGAGMLPCSFPLHFCNLSRSGGSWVPFEMAIKLL